MLVAARRGAKYLLLFGVIINILFIGFTQHYKTSSPSSSTSISSSSSSSSLSSSNKTKKTESSRSRSIGKRDLDAAIPQVRIVVQNGSGSYIRNDVNGNKVNKSFHIQLNQPVRTEEQMKKVNELKEKIALQIKLKYPNHPGRVKYGGSVKTLISPQRFCRPSSTAVTLRRGLLVIMVTSQAKDFRIREAIRRTWADVPEVHSGQVRIVHLLGTQTDNDETTRYVIKSEAEGYGDIIQGAFEDTYKNLTTKTLMGLEWAATQCGSSFKFFMKTDSDVYVNLPKLAEYLRELKDWEKPYAFGRKWVDVKPIRSPLMKWFVPESEYPGSTYPPYLGGSAYVMSSAAVRLAYHEARSTRLVRLEDLFLGICFQKAGVQLSDEPRFSVSLKRIVDQPCDIHDLFTHHGVQHYNLHHIKVAQDHPDLCLDET